MFADKTLLISGGTGFFGNAVMCRLLQTDIGEIRIFSRDEKKQDDMRKRQGAAEQPVIARSEGPWQSRNIPEIKAMDCFAALAMTAFRLQLIEIQGAGLPPSRE